MTAALVTRDLVIDIPGRDDGRALSLTVHTGERWGILGPNGAGKTTLLLTLAGLRKPRSGVVEVQGRRGNRVILRAFHGPGVQVWMTAHQRGFHHRGREAVVVLLKHHADASGNGRAAQRV